jgi:hypothetical protein
MTTDKKKSLIRTAWFTLASLVLVSIGSKAWAAFSSKGTGVSIATASLSSLGGTASAETSYRSITGNVVDPSSITWLPQHLTLGASQWVVADTYLVISATMTAVGGVQIYTDNTDILNAMTFTKYDGVGVSTGGLFYSDPTGPDPDVLPMAWRVTDQPLSVTHPSQIPITQGSTCNSTTYSDWLVVDSNTDGSINNGEECYPVFLWLTDLKDTLFGGTQSTMPSYARIKDADDGIQHAEDTWSRTRNPEYVYIAADFMYALAGRDYGTNLVVEWYTE